MKKVNKLIEELKVLLKENPNALFYLDELTRSCSENANSDNQLTENNSDTANESNKEFFYIYSDGGCRGNPGPGAYGFVIKDHQKNLVKEDSGYFPNSTNNKMEMMACIKGLDYLSKNFDLSKLNVTLISDSQYLLKGMKEWMIGWKKRGWKKSDKKEPENLNLWKQLDQFKTDIKTVEYEWVKGHSGHAENERCDELVNICLDQHE